MSSSVLQIGSACLRAALPAVVAVALSRIPGADMDAERWAILMIGGGAAVGCAAAGFQTHPRRSLGLVPVAATGLGFLLIPAALSDAPCSWVFCLTLGLFAGVAGPALRALLQAVVPPRLPAAPIDAVATAAILTPLALIDQSVLAPSGWWCGVLATAACVAAVVAWGFLSAPVLELLVEFAFWPMYRIRAHGPGAGRVPRRGPLLLVANHSSYADPFWLSKVTPRKVTPMMTSVFYDLPVIRPLMAHVVGAIRVPAGGFRREAPELAEAVAVLRGGGCVLIFPEGGLRKREETLLGRFGQGVWHILREAPGTPVVVCWVEGGWGSFASYRGGRPMRNKCLDRRRPIDIAVAEPCLLGPDVLADHRTTRAYLRRACLECRRLLGLPIPEEVEKTDGGADEQGGEEAPEANAHQINP